MPAVRSLFALYDTIELAKVGRLVGLPEDSTRDVMVAAKMRTIEVRGGADAPAAAGPLGYTDSDVHFSVAADGVVEVAHADDETVALEAAPAALGAGGAGAGASGSAGASGRSLDEVITAATMAAQELRLGAGGAGGRKGASGGALESLVRTLGKVHQQRVRAVKNSSRLAEATLEQQQKVRAERQASGRAGVAGQGAAAAGVRFSS